MRISPRIIIPCLLALTLAGTFVGYIWWHVYRSAKVLEEITTAEGVLDTIAAGDTFANIAINPEDRALFHMHQGDVLAQQNNWAEAEKHYKESVRAGGGLPALRKEATAQLQLRDYRGVESSIAAMKKKGARVEDVHLLEVVIALWKGEIEEARSILDTMKESPQQDYGSLLLAIIEGNHSEARKRAEAVQDGWDPLLRAHAKKIAAAYSEYDQFPNESNEHLVTLLSHALAQVQQCELALPLLEQITTSITDYRDAWITKGFCELTTGRDDEALASLQQAYSIDPVKLEIQYFLGLAYAATDDATNAIRLHEYALINGFEPASVLHRHIVQEALTIDQDAVAQKHLEALVAGEESSVEDYTGLVALLIRAGDIAYAHDIALQSVEVFPDSANSYDLLGWTEYEQGEVDKALSSLQQALDINPHLQSALQRKKNIEEEQSL